MLHMERTGKRTHMANREKPIPPAPPLHPDPTRSTVNLKKNDTGTTEVQMHS